MTPTLGETIEAIRAVGQLDGAQEEALARLAAGGPEPRALLGELAKLGWITAYQAELVGAGRGRELLMEPYLLLRPLGRGGMGQVYQAKVTRVTQFGAFVELEPGVEALAHVSTFPPTGRPGGWQGTVTVGEPAAFEILSIDPAQKRIGVAPVADGTSRAASAVQATGQIVPGARLIGKVEKHEPFGVFVFLAPGRSGLMPMSETGTSIIGRIIAFQSCKNTRTTIPTRMTASRSVLNTSEIDSRM